MGRTAQHGEAAILAGARRISAAVGPQKLTIAAVAKAAGAPVGSIYHRYASRDEILAAVWLDLVEEFQERFLAELEADDVIGAGLAAVCYVCGWVRRHPREARLLLLHRREDFASERWPASYRQRAERLALRAGAAVKEYTQRLTGRSRAPDVRGVRFALVDLPTAALKHDIERGESPSASVEALLLDTCAFALRRAARTTKRSNIRR